ncbi:wall-associated receptor kinase-like 8 [Bidens hawaiensis]|uniref:wall-associated receptor kinase-like 8 n=1 Tax=Bidens hawaiensis TaxID=980011 RepID=UPI00404A4024
MRIPYPFGIGANCSVNQWYTVDCNSSTPYLPSLNHLEVLGVNLEDQTVTVNMPNNIYDCQNPAQNSSQTRSIDLGNTPFLFSRLQNKFIFNGCGNGVMTDNYGSVVTGCSTTCLNDSTVRERNKCYGFSCCQATIPHHLKSYNMNVTGSGEGGVCRSAFLVDEDSYAKGSFSVAANNAFVPVSLMWTLTYSDISRCCDDMPRNLELKMYNGTSVESKKCSLYSQDEGNPYLIYGCQTREECARCRGNNTYCDYDTIYSDDGSIRLTNFTCGPSSYSLDFGSKSSTGVILGNIFLPSFSNSSVFHTGKLEPEQVTR